MLVNFYNNKSANNVVHKNIGSVISSQRCQIWDDISIQQPVLLVDYSDSLIDTNYSDALIDANYCYIEKFKRYYYIVDSTVYDGNKLKLSLASDVLMSFWNSFSGSQCQAKRSSSHPNWNMDDPTRVYEPQPTYYPRKLGGMEFTPSDAEGYFVLTIGG